MKTPTSLLGEISRRLCRFQTQAQEFRAWIISWHFAFCLILLTACSHSEEKADIVIINGAEPESLDPAIATVQADMRVGRSLFEGLVRLDPKTVAAAPALSDRWEISPDGTVYTFHIRTNAVWSTGEPITTADVLYSWIRALEPTTGADYAGQFFFVKNAEAFNSGKLKDPNQVGIHAIDAHNLRVELLNPTPFFLDLCSFPTFAVVPKATIEKYGDRWLMAKPLPCSGPYTMDFWRIHDKIRLRKNPKHWDAANVLNNVVDFLPSESAMTALNIYESKQADIIWDKNLIPTELMDVVGKRPDCHLYDYLATYFLRFNVTKKPFDDPRVRKALTLAIDRKRIVEKITKSGEKPAYHLVPEGTKAYQPPQGWGYDPDLARKFLAEAGYPGGKGFPSFQYLSRVGKMDEQVAVEIQAMYKDELGIPMEIRLTETKVYFTAQRMMDFDISRSSWIGDYNDPSTFLGMFITGDGNNRTGWSNPKYDELIRVGNRELDPTKREKILQEAELLLIKEETPIAPIYFYAGVLFFRPDEIDGVYYNLLDEHPIYCIRKLKTGAAKTKDTASLSP